MEKVTIKVREHKTIQRTIEVVLPYYYKHEIYGDDYTHHIYGKIGSKVETTIQEGIYYDGRKNFEIEEEKWDGSGSYFADEHKSNEQEYNKAKERLEAFFNCL